MSRFNMINQVPASVTIPEYAPTRQAPIYPYQTRRYYCNENLKNLKNKWGRLSWKIQCPDRLLTWQKVKLVLPLRIRALDSEGANIDMRLSSKMGACNVAIADSPMQAFRQTSLTLNGAIFSEENSFRRILDTCYIGEGINNQANNHSLKPICCRDLVNAQAGDFVQSVAKLVDAATGNVTYQLETLPNTDTPIGVRTQFIQPRTIDHASSLLENNGGFIERARQWQDNLSADGTTWEGEITNLLELGPFQARARKTNTTVPYIDDFHLVLNFNEFPAALDNTFATAEDINLSQRVVPSKLLEFATVPTFRSVGEKVDILSSPGFPCGFEMTWLQDPYLEVTFCKFLAPMKPVYQLRCFDHQLESSNDFELPLISTGVHAGNPTFTDAVESQSVRARINSRLLAYPTKIYLYADHARQEAGPFILGNCRRSCELSNIHCTILNRPDVLFNPSQEECFTMFQRNTNSSLDFQSWRRAPIYCFTPNDLGQSDMFANDARVTVFSWEADVQMTPLLAQESSDCLLNGSLTASGYARSHAATTDFDVFKSPDASHHFLGATCTWQCKSDAHNQGIDSLSAGATKACFSVELQRTENARTIGFDQTGTHISQCYANTYIQVYDTPDQQQAPTGEIMHTTTLSNYKVSLNGLIWARMRMDDGQVGNIRDNRYFYVPQGYSMDYKDDPSKLKIIPFMHLQQDAIEASYRSYVIVADSYVKGVKEAFNGTTPASASKACFPGPYAYEISSAGINNVGGPTLAGAGNYKGIDQTKTKADIWVALQPNFAALSNWMKWTHTNGGVTAGSLGHGNGYGTSQLTIIGQVKRGVQGTEAKKQNMKAATTEGVKRGMNIQVLAPQSLDDYNFKFSMKALYEYGNSTYEFSNRGLPTKVHPNFVPVQDNAPVPRV